MSGVAVEYGDGSASEGSSDEVWHDYVAAVYSFWINCAE